MFLVGGRLWGWFAARGKRGGASLAPSGADTVGSAGRGWSWGGLSTWQTSGISKVELSPPPCFLLNRPQSSSTSGTLVCAVRNETCFPTCFLSFLIKISKAYLSVAEQGKLRQRLFFNWNMPRAVTHSSRGGRRLMAGHVDGTATD